MTPLSGQRPERLRELFETWSSDNQRRIESLSATETIRLFADFREQVRFAQLAKKHRFALAPRADADMLLFEWLPRTSEENAELVYVGIVRQLAFYDDPRYAFVRLNPEYSVQHLQLGIEWLVPLTPAWSVLGSGHAWSSGFPSIAAFTRFATEHTATKLLEQTTIAPKLWCNLV